MAIATVTRPSGELPSNKGAIESEPLRDYFTNILTFLEGPFMRSGNVLTSTAGSNRDVVIVGDVDQIIASIKTFVNRQAAAGGIRTVAKFATDPVSGTAADEDGARLSLLGDNDSGVEKEFGSLDIVFTDVSNASEDARFVLRLMVAGTATSTLEVSSSAVYPSTDEALDLGTSAKKFDKIYASEIVATGTWEHPVRLGVARQWVDATNSVTRVKYGSDPANEQDGTFYSEAGGPGLE